MSLAVNYTFQGHGNWSLDSVGGSSTDGGVIDAVIPVNSTIERAFLYATTFDSAPSSGSVNFEGTTLVDADFTPLGVTGGFLQAFRADVTDLVAAEVGNGSAVPFAFDISDVASDNVDGYALAIVYSNAAEDDRSIIFADGASNQDGDTFTVDFPTPIDTTVPDFSALLSLGIGFGFQGSDQFSTVDVGGRRLTSFAGGQDDGSDGNGGLVTIGGLGDDPANPADPLGVGNEPRYDDELYDLAKGDGINPAPFLTNGASSLLIETQNPSDDDNIFFAGFNILGDASIETPENDAPIALDDAVATPNGVVLPAIAVLANDTDPESDPLTITELNGIIAVIGSPLDLPSGAQVTLNADGTIAYNPDDAFPGLAEGVDVLDSFTYTISDGQGGTATATVQVTVTGVVPSEEVCEDCAVGGVLGTEGADTLVGTLEDDFICGLGGNDTITGHIGNDKLKGGAGDDRLDGGNNDDSLYGGTGNDVLNGGNGVDLLKGGNGNDTLNGGNSDDTLFGEDGNDALHGSNGNDALDGGIGNDALYGENGADTILGAEGNDVIDGGTGNDRIEGGAGDDTMTGGVGVDTFVFNPGFGHDTITDFRMLGPVDDILEFDSSIFADTAALFANSVDVAGGVVVTAGADTLLIEDATLAQMQANAADFHFV